MHCGFYQIAGHTFQLSFPKWFFAADGLSNYAPLLTADGDYLFHVLVVGELPAHGDPELIGNFTDDIADIMVSRFADDCYLFSIAPPNGETCATMLCNGTFTEAKVVLSGDSQYHFFGLNNCLMMMYAFAAASLGTLMIHASVVIHEGKGYIFLGKSGTGKSTHSRLWLEHIADTELLNDDNPILKIEQDGSVRVYGSPWSGKTPCYKNESVPLSAIVRLQQAPHNAIRRHYTVQAFASLKPTCSTMPWDERIHNATCYTIAQIVEKTASYTLDCMPNKAAAELCFNSITDASRE